MQQLCPFFRLVARPIKRRFEKELDKRIRSRLRLVPITQFAEDDVFIVGYPKSGTTWMQNIIAGIVYGINPEYAPDTLIQDLVPEVYWRPYYRRYITPMFFKSHELPNPKYRRVIYLLRDGRDVMVSYFHYLKALKGKEVDFLKMVQDGEGLFPCKWHEHVEAWLANPYDASILIIKYENLKSNPLYELKRICDFIQMKRSEEFLKFVAQKTSFEIMRQKEIRYGWDNPEWPKDKPFVRRGQVGSYKDEMPKEILEAFEAEAGETLRKCGYL